MKNSIFTIITLSGMLLMLGGFAGVQIYVDPLFHYHAPTKGIEYPLYDEHYMNDGITRHFEYDAVITGSSMTENFKASIFNELFGTNAIKVPEAGGNLHDIYLILERAFARNDNIKVVLRGLDLTMLLEDKDQRGYDEYPEYLFDDNIWNDVYYVFNKELFNKYTDYVFEYNDFGGKTMNFDSYKNWAGLDIDAYKLRTEYKRREKVDRNDGLTAEEKRLLIANVEQNVIKQVEEHPDTEFYLFIPPYSILYWDDEIREGRFNRVIEMQEVLIDLLISYENVHLFSHYLDIAVTCNLNYYIDSLHYNQIVSEKILRDMAAGEREITKENKQFYLDTMVAFYSNFDYDAFFAGEIGY